MKLSNSFIDEMQALELSITRFIPTLVPIHQLDGAMPEDRYIYLAAHTLAHSAIMHLYRPFSRDDPGAYQKCLRGARAVVAIINNLGDRDYDLLDPMVGVRYHVGTPTWCLLTWSFSLALLDICIGRFDC